MCEPGQHSVSGEDSCTIAEAGTYAPKITEAVVTVDTGYNADIGMTHQSLCPPGYNCKDKTQRHNVLCTPGYYSSDDGTCTACPAGEMCPLGYTMSGHRTGGLTCPDGSWAGGNKLECEPCPPGYQCSDKTVIPVKCATGTYQIGGSITCSAIPDNHEANRGEVIAPCPLYHYSDGNTGDCLPCPDGMDCYLINSAPVSCGVGFYSGP